MKSNLMSSYKQINVRNDKSISLHKLVACDGGTINDEIIHIISHAHTDHFFPNKVVDTWNRDGIVVMSELSRQLLQYTGLPLRDNFESLKIVNHGETFQTNDLKIKLLENNHILGSCQIEIVDKISGYSAGYSGDFNKEIIEFIDVDYLVVDATYSGDVAENREWKYEEAETMLLEQISENLNKGPVNLIADSGLLQLIVHKLGIHEKSEYIIGKKEVGHFSKVYSGSGYEQPEVVPKESDEARELFRSGKYLWIGNSLADWPLDIPRGTTFIVKNFSPSNYEPITPIKNSDKMFKVSLTCHATQEEVFNYISGVNPKVVITDSSRNLNGSIKLAENVRKKLKIQSFTSEAISADV